MSKEYIRFVIGQTSRITDEQKRRLVRLANSLQGQAALAVVPQTEMGWAVQVTVELGSRWKFEDVETPFDEPVKFLTSFCSQLECGIYHCRGFMNVEGSIRSTETDMIHHDPRILSGVPIVLEIKESGPVVMFDTNWFNEFAMRHYSQPFQTQDELLGPTHPMRRVLCALSLIFSAQERTLRLLPVASNRQQAQML